MCPPYRELPLVLLLGHAALFGHGALIEVVHHAVLEQVTALDLRTTKKRTPEVESGGRQTQTFLET